MLAAQIRFASPICDFPSIVFSDIVIASKKMPRAAIHQPAPFEVLCFIQQNMKNARPLGEERDGRYVRVGSRQNRFSIFGPPDFFWGGGFSPRFFFFSSFFVWEKCPEKSSRKIPGKILQILHNKNPRHISVEGPGQDIFFSRKAPDKFNFSRHVMRAILFVRPNCSHRCVSLKESPLKPVQILKHTTRESTEQTSMRTKWFKHIAI